MGEYMNNSIFIWGTGRVGITAYYYYRDIYNICGYIDNDERKWGEILNGIKIYPPDVIKDFDATIVIAIRGGADSVAKQLKQEYGIEQYTLFDAGSKECFPAEESAEDEIDEDTCIVYFSGGLGNQMFQYAFYRTLQLAGKNVLAYYIKDVGVSTSNLLYVFRDIDLQMCTEKQKVNLVNKNVQNDQKAKRFLLYKEERTYDVKEKVTDTSIVNVSGGIFRGTFQTYRFADLIKEELKDIFVFQEKHERVLEKFTDYISSFNSVSIHIRRGDYLTRANSWIYGDICTEEYYEKAIEYCKKKIKNCKFVFFSNEIDWAKEHYQKEDALFIEDSMFTDYQDWYDMFLMSRCKHNIIANSTFSWWGAWLNQNEDKIVVAPKKWINTCEYKDVYPENWILM